MAFIDELKITAKAGDGGNGVVRWSHTKEKEKNGPSGGDGGNGGDIIVRAIRDLNALARYRGVSTFKAQKGVDGFRDEMKGGNGDPCVIDVPIGTHVTNIETGAEWDLLEEGVDAVILKGGRGGMGNARFKSSTNQYPLESTEGSEGEQGRFLIEVRLIADVGLVGLPNAGKSSLLNAFTNASAKVGSYQFTTLEPNLGVFHSYVIADIPGLIEGASSGKGLGHKFLRHIRRTRAILHCVAADQDDVSRIYEIVRGELAAYDPALAEKPEIIFLTKADTVTPDVLAAQTAALEKFAPVVLFSVIDDRLIKEGGDRLVAFFARGA